MGIFITETYSFHGELISLIRVETETSNVYFDFEFGRHSGDRRRRSPH